MCFLFCLVLVVISTFFALAIMWSLSIFQFPTLEKIGKNERQNDENLVERKLFLAISPSLFVFLTALGEPRLSLLLVFACDFLELIKSVRIVDHFINNFVQKPKNGNYKQ